MPPPRQYSPLEIRAFEELRRRRDEIRTHADRKRYELDVWRVANEPGYQKRLGEIGAQGRFRSGPWRKMEIPLAVTSIAAGAGAMFPPAAPVLAPLAYATGGSLAGLGAANVLEGAKRMISGRPGGLGQAGWGALDVLPLPLGRLLRKAGALRRGASQVAPPSSASATPLPSTSTRTASVDLPGVDLTDFVKAAEAGYPSGRTNKETLDLLRKHPTPEAFAHALAGAGPNLTRAINSLRKSLTPGTGGRAVTTPGPKTAVTPRNVAQENEVKSVEGAVNTAYDIGIAKDTGGIWSPALLPLIRRVIQQTNIVRDPSEVLLRELKLWDDEALAKLGRGDDAWATANYEEMFGFGDRSRAYLLNRGLDSGDVKGILDARRALTHGGREFQTGQVFKPGERLPLKYTPEVYPPLKGLFPNDRIPAKLITHLDMLGLEYRKISKMRLGGEIVPGLEKESEQYLKAVHRKLGERLGQQHNKLAKLLEDGKLGEKEGFDLINKSFELACSDCGAILEQGNKQLNLIRRSMKNASILGAIAGGAGGYAMGDEETKIGNALVGAVMGGALPPMARSLLTAKGASDKYQAYVFWSLLGRASPAMRANLGAVGGVYTAAVERTLEGMLAAFGGDGKKGAELFKQGARILGGAEKGVNPLFLGPGDFVGKWFKNFAKTPEALQARRAELLGADMAQETGRLTPEAIRATGRLSNLYGAGDVTAVEILTKLGHYTPEEALRFTLTGTPSTRMGKQVLDFLSVKPGQQGMVPMLKTTLSPFPRVSVVGVEEGLKRIPGLGPLLMAGQKLRPGLGGGLRPESWPQALAQSATGAGTIYAGKQLWGQLPSMGGIDPRVLEVAKGAVGPGQAILEGARNFERSRQEGATRTEAGLKVAEEAVIGASPFGFRPAALLSSPASEVQRRLVPGFVGDLARGLDPAFNRETGRERISQAALRGEIPFWMSSAGPYGSVPSQMAPLFAQLPIVRQATLPPRFAPVDLEGRPRFRTPEAPILPDAVEGMLLGTSASERGQPTGTLRRLASRTLFPLTQAGTPPPIDVRQDPQLQQAKQFGLLPQPPRPSVQGRRGPLQQTPQSAAAVQLARGQQNRRQLELLRRMPPNMNPRQLARYIERSDRRTRQRRLHPARVRSIARGAGARQPGILTGPLPWNTFGGRGG